MPPAPHPRPSQWRPLLLGLALGAALALALPLLLGGSRTASRAAAGDPLATSSPSHPADTAEHLGWLTLEAEAAAQFGAAFALCEPHRRNKTLRISPPRAAVTAAQRSLAGWLASHVPAPPPPPAAAAAAAAAGAGGGALQSLEAAAAAQGAARAGAWWPHTLLPVWPDRFAATVESEHGCFSQNTEDGILLWIFALIGTTGKRALEVASGAGYENNLANLALFHGWRTLQVEGRAKLHEWAVKFYKQPGMPCQHPPVQRNAFITAEAIGQLIVDAGFGGPVDLFSLDMDGMDFWVLRAALNVTQPRVLVVEVQDIYGWMLPFTRPYSPKFAADKKAYTESIGVTMAAYLALLSPQYRLVGCIRKGFNAFFVHRSCPHPLLPELHPASCFAHLERDMRQRLHYSKRLKAALKYTWVDVGNGTQNTADPGKKIKV